MTCQDSERDSQVHVMHRREHDELGLHQTTVPAQPPQLHLYSVMDNRTSQSHIYTAYKASYSTFLPHVGCGAVRLGPTPFPDQRL